MTDNDYCTLFNSKDSDGDYGRSSWCESIEKAKKNIVGDYCGHLKEYLDNFDLEIVEIFRLKYEPFKVGDKVRILDSIKKTSNWEKIENNFPDMTGEIKYIWLQAIGTHYLVNGFFIGHEYLAPLVEQEDNVALEAIKVLEEKGYKIVKK